MSVDHTDSERNAGLLLMAAAAVALVIANSPLAARWHHLLDYPLGIELPRVGMLTPHLFVADGLMAVFFLLVGLEVKREWFDGRLSTADQRKLPLLAAAAGMAVPALIYLLVVRFDSGLARGWAIPAATDIAFVIGVLALLGPRASPTLKLLLVAIAIADDLGAVAVIALAYTSALDIVALGAALGVTAAMALLGTLGVRKLWPFLIGFALLWILILASGVHATIAGVLAALTIPLGAGEAESPLRRLEHTVHPFVMFGIVPLFGLVSAGVTLPTSTESLLNPVTVAVAGGLFLGKQVGVFGAIRIAVSTGIAARPAGVSWRQIYGGAILCGVGFTMSLFIGALAFPETPAEIDAAKVGTLAGSILSAIVGFLVLRSAAPVTTSAEELEQSQEIFAGDLDD
jgi:NhaA family Na+:H+ antiporter